MRSQCNAMHCSAPLTAALVVQVSVGADQDHSLAVWLSPSGQWYSTLAAVNYPSSELSICVVCMCVYVCVGQDH